MAFREMSQKGLLPSVIFTLFMFTFFMPAQFSVINVNCSEPTQLALLKALTPLFNMTAIRPVVNSKTCTNVSIIFTIYGILGVDEKAQLLKTYIWLSYWWPNEFVTWDAGQCGSDRISLPREKFWVPDIVINEFMDENTAPSVPYVFLFNTGMVHDAHPVRIISSCNLDIYTFPFDIQNCTLTFNSYLHYASDIRLFLGNTVDYITERSKRVMTTLGEWELLTITAHTSNDTYGDYIDTLAFHIRLKRRATMYVVNLLIPSCFLITVDLFSFLLPPQSVDRSSFKMTLILGYTVFLLIMNDLLPVTGNAIPLINVFFSLCLALMVASLLETIVITNLLSGAADFGPVPNWIRVLLLQILGPLVCLRQKNKKSKHFEMKTQVGKNENIKAPTEVGSPVDEGKAVQELRSLGKDVQSIRLLVEKQLKQNDSEEEWIQCSLQKVKSSKLLFLFISVLMCAPSSSMMLNCSEPDTPSLLEALRPVFNLSAIRPVVYLSTATNVTLDFTLFGILGVDEKAQVLTTFIWQTLKWKNEFLSWDSESCGTERITVPRKLLWVPDVVINEFMEKNTAPFVPYTYLFHDGWVIDGQPVRVVSSCRLDTYAFPFDIQNCTFSFNSYLHHRAEVEIELQGPADEIFHRSKDVITTMGEWELISINSRIFELISGSGHIYEELRFFIGVRRRATLYIVNLLIPTCFLITVDLFSFILPPKSVDRSLFKMTLILGYTVFLLSMNNMLPVSGNTIPLINVFLTLCLSLMVASLLETIIITNLICGSARYPAVPRWIRVIFLHILGRLVCLPPKSKDQEDTVISNPSAQEMKLSSTATQESETKRQESSLNGDKAVQELRSLNMDLQDIRHQLEKQLRGNQDTEDWIQVGFVIDRLLFILYILFISTSFVTIIILWGKSYSTLHDH
ncbi:5-hydroxytryptamine receptor 3A-like isoform X2 [Salarias fasciatus]|uniref:5-hydroxytryptamine receptor 3A-like isoform X2 n=1 Tax=Salarias fasciatus TaxID=181472 RepID=UPI001176D85F|nr:5-hydroxytryptamine receptor 3A-like isoform X2 [Salarias fasciatus]